MRGIGPTSEHQNKRGEETEGCGARNKGMEAERNWQPCCGRKRIRKGSSSYENMEAVESLLDWKDVGKAVEMIYYHRMIESPAFRSMGGGDALMMSLRFLAVESPSFKMVCSCLREMVSRFPDHVIHSPRFAHNLFWFSERGIFTQEAVQVCEAFLKGGVSVLACLSSHLCDSSFEDAVGYMLSAVSKECKEETFLQWPTRLAHFFENGHQRSALLSLRTPVTSYECPITLLPCLDPVLASDGTTYERDAILEVMKRTGRSPISRKWLDYHLVPNSEVVKKFPFSESFSPPPRSGMRP